MFVRDHKLLTDDNVAVPFVPSPNIGGLLERPQAVVIHYTAGRDVDSAVSSLTNPGAKASAHLVIGREGRIVQLVDFNRVAWHAGQSKWRGLTGLNKCSIGLELDNAGELTAQGKKWRSWFGGIYSATDVIVASHKHGGPVAGWQTFPELQLRAAIEAARAIVIAYGIPEIVGHDDIAPERKRDPGPAFPMSNFQASVLGRDKDAPDTYETTASVNLRTGPGIDFAKVQPVPLQVSTKVILHSSDSNWCYVDVLNADGGAYLNGWIFGDYLRRV